MATNGKPKRLTVKLKSKLDSEVPQTSNTSISLLDEFVEAVYSCSGPSLVPTVAAKYSFEELYNAVINSTAQKQGQGLYLLLRDKCQRQAGRLVVMASAVGNDARAFLATLYSLWTDYTSQTALIRAVFSYVESSITTYSNGLVVSVTDMCLHAFSDALVAAAGSSSGVLQRTLAAVRDIICMERDGENIDRSVVSAIVRMLSSLGTSNRSSGLYSSHLEPLLLDSSELYYAQEAAAKMAALDTATYLAHVNTRLRQEHERCHTSLLPHTWRALKPLLCKVLIAQHASALVERGFVALLQSSRLADLSLMYTLLSSVQRTDDMRRVYGEHCKAAALAITGATGVAAADAEADNEGDKTLVQSLLHFRSGQEAIIAQAFSGQETFTLALKAAVEAAANVREGKPAELIAKYLDQKLRSGGKSSSADVAGSASVSSDSFDAVLDRVMALFRLVHSKDIFEAFYKKDLAKRLLLGKSSSMDAEKSMVSRLKTECGSAFTSKLEGMFKDIDLSEQLMKQFQEQLLGASGPKPVDTTVHILTASYWPTYGTEPVILPPELGQACASFERFYIQKYNGNRRIAWVPSLGHCIVRAAFPTGPHPRKELEVSLYQALVLMLFNKGETSGEGSDQATESRTGGPLVFTTIKQMTGVPDAHLRSTLQSLALGKERVLRKEPKGKEVLDGDVFTWNEGYTSPLVRVKINQIQMKETKQEADSTTERVMQDRQYQLDAAIVRIMKARKSLGHAQLMSELLGQLRFQAKPADIKKRIESLIDREYLERGEASEGGAATYHYLA